MCACVMQSAQVMNDALFAGLMACNELPLICDWCVCVCGLTLFVRSVCLLSGNSLLRNCVKVG